MTKLWDPIREETCEADLEDGKRLDFLADHAEHIPDQFEEGWTVPGIPGIFPTFREAIDASRRLFGMLGLTET
jgi:hypothetical protein